tara:strand:- start:1025 stop:1318 length:294 start_codon:yes stop_codon:yes gene_type:complete
VEIVFGERGPAFVEEQARTAHGRRGTTETAVVVVELVAIGDELVVHRGGDGDGGDDDDGSARLCGDSGYNWTRRVTVLRAIHGPAFTINDNGSMKSF